jgi:hypothetical protein
MTITLENISIYIGIATFTAAVINYLIITPLKSSILALKGSIDKLDTKLNIISDKMDEYKERLVLVEASAKQAHKRIDRIDDIVDARPTQREAGE